MADEEQVMAQVTQNFTMVDEDQVMLAEDQVMLAEDQVMLAEDQVMMAPVKPKFTVVDEEYYARMEFGNQSATQDLDHFSQQALKRKPSSMSSYSSDASDSDRLPVPKKSKIARLKVNRARHGSGVPKTKTELKNQGVEQRKEIADLKKKLEVKNKELSSSRDCATSWEREYRDENKRFQELRKEKEEITSQNSKLRIENNKLKSTAGKTVLTILEEEVKGQLDGMRNQWAKLGTPPKTADHGVDAGVQTEDDSTSKKRAELKGDLDKVIAASMIHFRLLEAAKENADTAQGGLKVGMLEACELMKKLNENE